MTHTCLTRILETTGEAHYCTALLSEGASPLTLSFVSSPPSSYIYIYIYWQKLIRKLLSANPSERPTASQVASDDWLELEGNALSLNDLTSSLRDLETFNVKKKFRGIIRTVRASASGP